MEARYYSDVHCFFASTPAQIDSWLDRATDIGDRFGDGFGLFDVDFSANMAKLEIGIHAAHVLHDREHDTGDELMEMWTEAFHAVGHATSMLEYVSAVDHLQRTEFVLSKGAGDDRQELLTFAIDWRPRGDGDAGDLTRPEQPSSLEYEG
jgi:hypothetical protein